MKANDYISFMVPMTPPSVNHYVKHTRNGRHYVTSEAKGFCLAVGMYSARQSIRGKEYGVRISVYLGAKQKGDLDNFAKVVLDALVKARVIDTDSKITVLHLFKGRDPNCPRTVVDVWAIDLSKEAVDKRRWVAEVGAGTSELHHPGAKRT